MWYALGDVSFYVSCLWFVQIFRTIFNPWLNHCLSKRKKENVHFGNRSFVNACSSVNDNEFGCD